MKDEENGSEAGQTGKGDGNRGLPPVVRSISPTGGESKEVPIEPTCSECNIHFSKIDDELLLITMFGKSISLGFLRLNVVEAIERIKKIWSRK